MAKRSGKAVGIGLQLSFFLLTQLGSLAQVASAATDSVILPDSGSDAAVAGNAAVAIGANSTANATNATAIGAYANADAVNSTAIGSYSAALTNSAVLGTDASAGNSAVAVGFGSSSPSNRAVAVGEGASASANNSLALGSSASATGNNSVAIGAGVVASQANQIVLGSSSSTVLTPGVSGGVMPALPAKPNASGSNTPYYTVSTANLGSGYVYNYNDGSTINYVQCPANVSNCSYDGVAYSSTSGNWSNSGVAWYSNQTTVTPVLANFTSPTGGWTELAGPGDNSLGTVTLAANGQFYSSTLSLIHI